MLISFSANGQGEKINKLTELLNEDRYFESKELYNEIHNTLDFDDDLYYKYRMCIFMNKKDSITYCLEKMLEYYPEVLGEQALNAYVELFNLYFSLNDNEKGVSTYKRVVEYLEDNPDNIDENEIEKCRNFIEERLAYFKEAMSVPPVILRRKAADDYLDIVGKEKLRFDAKFNGIKHETIFDTGVGCYCVIYRYYAEKMGIECDTSKMVKGLFNNTEMSTYQIVVDSIEIGNILFYNFPVLILDHDISRHLPDSIKNDSIMMEKIDSVKNEMNISIIGLPAMQLIGKILIDYENNKLSFPSLQDTRKTPKNPNLFFINNQIYTRAEINNVAFTGCLDTGADGYIEVDSIFHEKYKNNIPIDTITEKKQYNFATFHRAWVNIPYEIPEKPIITFNNKRIPSFFEEDDEPVRIYSMQPVWSMKILDGVIGYDFFKRIGKKVLLDLDNMRLEAIE